MPKLTGIFNNFSDLDCLQAQDLNTWLKAKEQAFYLENFIGNRILYPQSIAYSLNDLETDLAILREYIRKNPAVVYTEKSKRLIIPEEFGVRFPPLQKLVSALLDVLNLGEVTTIVSQKFNGATEVAGTVIRAIATKGESFADVNVNGQLIKLEYESMSILPNKDQHIVIQIDSNPPLNVVGGSLGIIIDLRKS